MRTVDSIFFEFERGCSLSTVVFYDWPRPIQRKQDRRASGRRFRRNERTLKKYGEGSGADGSFVRQRKWNRSGLVRDN